MSSAHQSTSGTGQSNPPAGHGVHGVAFQKTHSVRAGDITRQWLLFDADGLILGRLASMIAYRLRGKHKVTFSPHLDVGDYVVVVNVHKIRVTGKKEGLKNYYRHSGYPGGLKQTNLATLRANHPSRILISAVRGMLPKGPLGRQMLKKLKVYTDDNHPHSAQMPTVVKKI